MSRRRSLRSPSFIRSTGFATSGAVRDTIEVSSRSAARAMGGALGRRPEGKRSLMENVPSRQGLYDPRFEHDSCGIGFVADIHGRASSEIVQKAIQVLLNLEHRGACGCEKNTGRRRRHPDPDAARLPRAGVRQARHHAPAPRPVRGRQRLPAHGTKATAAAARSSSSGRSAKRACASLGWRTLPTDNSSLGPTARAGEPAMRQLFLSRPEAIEDDLAYERKLYVVRRRIENAARASEIPGRRALYIPSLSQRTLVYKGMLIAPQLPRYFPDLVDDARRVGAGDGALALLDQHLPELGARAPVPLRLPQRRDQHAARQRQLDARAGEPLRLVALRRRAPEAAADRRHRRQRLGDVRQRARAARALRTLAAPRDDDDDPRAVGRPRVDEREEARVLRVPLLPDGALGRPGLDRLHRRRPHRRDARPERPAALALLRHQGRPGRARLRGRRPRHPGGPRAAQGSPAAGAHVPGRHRGGPDRRGRGDQAAHRERAAVRPLAARQPGDARRRSRRDRPRTGSTTRRCCSASSPSATPARTSSRS